MEKIINKLINNAIEGVDTYFHNGSMWLIFTDRKEWVIELDKNGKLWYYYDFFKNLFNYASLDVIENQHYITMWVEDAIQNGVKSTLTRVVMPAVEVEDAIQNGVKNTFPIWYVNSLIVEDTIQNGVKDTYGNRAQSLMYVEDIIRNGNLICKK